MGKLSAIAFMITIIAPLPAVAYTQEDAHACTPALFKINSNSAPPAATCSIGHVARVSTANAQ